MPAVSRLNAYGALSFLLAYLVVDNAVKQRGQFFTTCIHLTRSNVSLMILLNLGLYLAIISGKALQRLFFGTLRAVEVEHLYERSWFAITETCLAMTIFRDEFDVRFITLFALLLFCKLFHWLAQDRVDFMDQGDPPNRIFHLRMISLMTLLFLTDLGMFGVSVEYTTRKGPSMMIIFGFEYTLLISLVSSTFVKYILHSVDLASENAWDDKSMYIFYLDLVVGK